MWYIIIGIYLVISAIFALIFWFSLIAAKRSDEKDALDSSDNKPEDT